MCWTTEKLECFEPQVADEEIFVLKIGRWDEERQVATPYYKYNRKFVYVEGEEYTETITKCQWSARMYIEQGLHSYNQDYVWFKIEPWIELPWIEITATRKSKNRVIYEFATFRGIPENLSLIEGHLPVGTTYFINEDYEIVSDRLFVNRITPFSKLDFKKICVGQPQTKTE